MRMIIQAGIFFCAMSLLTGIIYPALITAIAQLVWPAQSNGSLIRENEIIRGSSLIAQEFTGLHYFWPRPSASSYSALPSSGSNLGPTSKALKKAIAERRASLVEANENANASVPESLVTASASGLDPHIPLTAALWQMARIAKARNLNESKRLQLQELVEKNEQGILIASLGLRYVNVLLLNLALDEAFGKIVR